MLKREVKQFVKCMAAVLLGFTVAAPVVPRTPSYTKPLFNNLGDMNVLVYVMNNGDSSAGVGSKAIALASAAENPAPVKQYIPLYLD